MRSLEGAVAKLEKQLHTSQEKLKRHESDSSEFVARLTANTRRLKETMEAMMPAYLRKGTGGGESGDEDGDDHDTTSSALDVGDLMEMLEEASELLNLSDARKRAFALGRRGPPARAKPSLAATRDVRERARTNAEEKKRIDAVLKPSAPSQGAGTKANQTKPPPRV